MAEEVRVNGQIINYPETGDTNWGDEATEFAVQTSAAFGKLGLASGTSVDIGQTLDVTGNTTLDANLSVGGDASVTGNTTLTGNLSVNGNSTLGNGTSDTTAITGILNVDSGVLYVDPTNNRVGINDATPSEALDVTGNIAITGNETVGGTLNVTGAATLSSTLAVTGNSTLTGNLSVNGNSTLGDASGDSLTINGNSVSIPNGLNFDSNTLVINATNNRVGINDSSPAQALDVTGRIALKSSSGSGEAYINLGESSTGSNNWVYGSNGVGDLYFYNNTASASNQRLAIQSNGQIQAVVPGGSAFYPGYLCRAWAIFPGTAGGSLTAGGNVSSITRTGTGSYTVTFANNLPDTNYAVCIGGGANVRFYTISTQSIGSFTALVTSGTAPGTPADQTTLFISVFR